MNHPSWGLKILFVSVFLLCAFNLTLGHAAVGGGGESSTTITTSTTHHDTFSDIFLNPVRQDLFLTRLTAHIANDTPLVDLVFNMPFGDPVIQNAIDQAKAILNAAAAPNSLSFSGPLLLSSLETLEGSATNFIQNLLNHTETSVTTSTSFGPATILIGEEQSQTFFVAAGTLNVNTNTHTENFLDKFFQNTDTYLLNEHYDLIGKLQTEAVATPEPGTFLLFGLGLASIGLARLRR